MENPNDIPLNAIKFCMKEAGLQDSKSNLDLQAIDYIGFSLEPKTRYRDTIQHRHPYFIDDGEFGSQSGERIFYSKCLSIEPFLRENGFKGRFFFLDHHSCHAASAFYTSPFNHAATLVIDGIGEFHSTSIFRENGGSLSKHFTIAYPNSLGFLWEKFSAFLGFNDYDAAKVMVIASYGNRMTFIDKFNKIIAIKADFEIDDRVVCFRNHDFSKIEALFNLPKRVRPITEVNSESRPYADIAASLQHVTEEIIIALANRAYELNHENLCLSGGVVLNCVANGRLLRETQFKQVFIPPYSNDAGTAIGAAYFIYHMILKNKRIPSIPSPYLGPKFSESTIRKTLDENGIRYKHCNDIEKKTSELLVAGKIIAWFQGPMEAGPRALGNRSILADPRRKEIVEKLNRLIKHRESFRPFCPSILEEEVKNWFDWQSPLCHPVYYMLATFKILPHKRAFIPAVVHVDGTARIQAVKYEMNPRFYRLINEFRKKTDIPMLLNTSLNDREPIVCTPTDALNTFLKVDIDYLVMDNFLISKQENYLSTKIPDIPLKLYFEKLR